MFGLQDYIAVKSPDQAYDLLMQDKNNVILGGLLWMRMGSRQYHVGIDLGRLGLDRITETADTVEIGAMTSLRKIETSPVLSQRFGPLFSLALGPIVGVQFRNLATLGGSVYSRFGFSDVITALQVLDTQVQLHQAGTIPLETFLSMSDKKDILLRIIIKKQQTRTAYQAIRKSAADFPVLSLAAARCEDTWAISVGARPYRACRAIKAAGILPPIPDDAHIQAACDALTAEIRFGADQRGSREYRSAMVKTLLRRGIETICR